MALSASIAARIAIRSTKLDKWQLHYIYKLNIKAHFRELSTAWSISPYKCLSLAIPKIFLTVMTLATLAYAGAIATIIVLAPTLYAFDYFNSEMPSTLGRITLITSVALCISSLIGTLRYMTQNITTAGKFTPPILPLPRKEIDLARRKTFLRGIYLYWQLPYIAITSAIIGVLQMSILQHLIFEKRGIVYPKGQNDTLIEIAWLSGLVVALFSLFTVENLIKRTMTVADAALTLQKFMDGLLGFDRSVTVQLKIDDPFGKRRKELFRAIKIISTLAIRMDSKHEQHPIASTLLGCSHGISRYLRQLSSLNKDLPDQVRRLLFNTIAVLAGANGSKFLKEVNLDTNAFNEKSDPEAWLRDKPHGLIAHLVDNLDKYTRLTTSLWGLFTVGAATYLIISGKIDLKDMQIQR
ncbi:hypothetical protein GCM10018963_54550 [Saccharothrix longispora]